MRSSNLSVWGGISPAAEAKRKHAELAKEQNAPTLDRFILYEDDRFICEKVTR
jgi:hypothetical protein